MPKKNYLSINLDLPDHSEELKNAEESINKIKNELKLIINEKSITDELHEILFEKIIYLLDYVGQLSVTAYDIANKLEELYYKTYPHSPMLAKKLWQEHFTHIHHPYNILKNRCFRLIDELDLEYYNVHHKDPPNMPKNELLFKLK